MTLYIIGSILQAHLVVWKCRTSNDSLYYRIGILGTLNGSAILRCRTSQGAWNMDQIYMKVMYLYFIESIFLAHLEVLQYWKISTFKCERLLCQTDPLYQTGSLCLYVRQDHYVKQVHYVVRFIMSDRIIISDRSIISERVIMSLCQTGSLCQIGSSCQTGSLCHRVSSRQTGWLCQTKSFH